MTNVTEQQKQVQAPVVPPRPYEAPITYSTGTAEAIPLGGKAPAREAVASSTAASTSPAVTAPTVHEDTTPSTNTRVPVTKTSSGPAAAHVVSVPASTSTTVEDGSRLNASGLTDERAGTGNSAHVPMQTTEAYSKNPVLGDKPVDAAYGKHNEQQHLGLMDRVKNALTGHPSEPKSTEAHNRRV